MKLIEQLRLLCAKKRKPTEQSITKCFRLSTDNRKKYLLTDIQLMDIYKENVHQVLQKRFLENPSCNFDVDTRREEEELLAKIKSSSIIWGEKFNFGRGVEISKSGNVVFCSKCGCAQGYKKSQLENGEKICTFQNICQMVHQLTSRLHTVSTSKNIKASVLRCGIEDWRKRSSNCNCTGTDHCICDLLDLYDQKI